MSIVGTLAITLVAAVVLSVALESAGYERDTHRALSLAAFDRSDISSTLQQFGIQPTDTFRQRVLSLKSGRQAARGWVRLGGSDEDVPFFRVLNHFYDPVHDTSIVGAAKAPDWALEEQGDLEGQNHSYKDARQAFYNGLTLSGREQRERELGHTFYALGHVIHLIQDMAQSQHTRGDLHPPLWSLKSLTEEYVEEHSDLFSLSGADMPVVAGARDLWVSGSGRGFAQFSNANFVSAGTNFTELRTGVTAERFSSPMLDVEKKGTPPSTCKDGTEAPGSMTFYANTFADPVSDAPLRNALMTTHSIFDQHLQARGKQPIFALNCFNIDAAADILLPRAVAYSAALLKYFFRGQLEAHFVDERYYIANQTPGESMEGSFELFYDTPDGTRRRLSSWTLSLGANADSGPLTTAMLPPDQPAETRCLVVFRGRMGEENDNIAGVLAPCPRTSEPVPPTTPAPPPDGGIFELQSFCQFLNALGQWQVAPPFFEHNRDACIAAAFTWNTYRIYRDPRDGSILRSEGPI